MFPSSSRVHHTSKGGFTFQAIAIALIAAYSCNPVSAQVKYNVGVTADITGGGNTPIFAGSSLTQSSWDLAPFIGTYPSVTFRAIGEHSSLDSTYGFGYDRTFSDPTYETKSHNATVAFSSKFGPKWSFHLSDSYYKSSNISSFRFLSGLTQVPDPTEADQFQFVFTPVFFQSNHSNTATVGLDRILNKKSSLLISGSYSTLDYPNASSATGVLSDQKRISASVSFKRSGEHYSWTIGYSGARFNFAAFQNSLNHSATVGYFYQFSPTLSFEITAGPSFLEGLDTVKSPLGTTVTATLNRSIPRGSLAVSASHTSSETSGLGSVSRNRDIGFNMSHALGKNATVSANVSGFNTQGLTVNGVSARGISGGGTFGLALSRDWSLNWGGHFQHYEGYNTSGYDQKRLFMSLRYNKPELWRF
jgi:hypothetical protein